MGDISLLPPLPEIPARWRYHVLLVALRKVEDSGRGMVLRFLV